MAGELLIAQEKYLEAGIHIGTKIRTPDMAPFIYKARQDKLYVLDLKKLDERIRIAAKMIARYPPESVLVVASRTYAGNAASTFARLTGVNIRRGRVIPGIFTNPMREDFIEPKLLIVSDPKGERQAVKEAAVIGIPVIGLCDTDNSTKFIDWVVPCNNKGKKSIALVYYLLARETLKARGTISSDEQFTTPIEEFEEKASEASGEPAGEVAEEPAVAAESQKEEPATQAPQPSGST